MHFQSLLLLITAGILMTAVILPASGSGATPGQPIAAGTLENTGNPPQFDILIRGGKVVDGTGSPWHPGDIGITGNRITAMGRLTGATARKVIDAGGLIVAPGFIDPHTHAARGLATAELSHARPMLAQGITSILANPDGSGPVGLQEQRQNLLEHGLGVNVGLLIPHGAVRRQVMGTANRHATAEELEQMGSLVRQGMKQGAFGLSTGIFYVPGSFAPTGEFITLCRIVAEYGGVHQSHIRDESDYSVGVVTAVDEIIEITRESGVTGVVTHIKALGPAVWGASGEINRNIARARSGGLPVFTDQYPYSASATSMMAALVPDWAREGGEEGFRQRLADPADRERILQGIIENLERRGGADRLQYRRFTPDPSVEGRLLSDVADEQGLPPEKLILAQIGEGNAGLVSFNMHDDDLRAFMVKPWNMTSSDGGYVPFGSGVPHPRNYGSFPRKIRKYVSEEELLTLEDAVRSMTSLTAGVYGMHDRGLLRPGMIADIAIFDPDAITDRATYQEPHQYSEGMVWVIVNGGIAIQNGEFTGALYGEILTKPGVP
jgi:N-acyl-D-amino-acid deacylase